MIRRFDSSLFALCVADLTFLFFVFPFAELVQRRWPTWFLASARLDILDFGGNIQDDFFLHDVSPWVSWIFFSKRVEIAGSPANTSFAVGYFVTCQMGYLLPSSPPVKKVHANSPSLRPGHIHLLKRARFLDSRTPGPICFVPGFPAQF